METNKVIAYSLLAQIRNSGNFINSSVEIFVPIVKYALYKHITQTGVYKGASIIEISTWINKYFGLEFPSVVLEKILGEFYQFNLSSCIRQQNSLTAQFVSFSLSNLANIFYPPQFLQ